MLKQNATLQNVLLSVEYYRGSLDNMRSAAQTGLYQQCGFFSRLLVWKCSLITHLLAFRLWDTALSRSREIYNRAKKTPPWYMLDPDCEFHDNLPADSDDVDLLQSIVLDVQRVFPGEPFYQSRLAKKRLITVLYAWANEHSIGYKQGMHEVMGLIDMTISPESVTLDNTNTLEADERAILALFDERFAEHDLYALFSAFVLDSGVIALFYESETRLSRAIREFDSLLLKVDQLVHYNLVTKLHIESQLWIIRYLRVVLLREISNLDLTIFFWDKLVALDVATIPDLVVLLVVVLLVHLKQDLVTCDFAEALTLLLHYPSRFTAQFLNSVFADAQKLLRCRNDDFKLYEAGRRLTRTLSSSSTLSTPPTAEEQRRERLAFDKKRLELRLKRRVLNALT